MNFRLWFWLPTAYLLLIVAAYAASLTELGTVGNYWGDPITSSQTSCTLAASGSSGCSGIGGSPGGDCGITVDFTATSTVTITLPNNLTQLGCTFGAQQDGTGSVTFVPASGATLVSPHSFTKTFAAGSVIGVRLFKNTGGTAAQYILWGDGQ